MKRQSEMKMKSKITLKGDEAALVFTEELGIIDLYTPDLRVYAESGVPHTVTLAMGLNYLLRRDPEFLEFFMKKMEKLRSEMYEGKNHG